MLPSMKCIDSRRKALSQLKMKFSPGIFRSLRGGWSVGEGGGMRCGDKNDLESAMVQHSVEATRAFAQGERSRLVVPVDGDLREGALLVVEGGSLVLIEDEASISPRVDEEGRRAGELLADVLHGRGVRDD
jgi:hypothetical protein